MGSDVRLGSYPRLTRLPQIVPLSKTLSARRYARWDLVEPAVQTFTFFEAHRIPREILETRSAVYTPKVHNSPGQLENELALIQGRLSWAIETLEHPEHDPPALSGNQGRHAEFAHR